MSTQKGNSKKKGQKYQTRTAFKIQFNEKAEEISKKTPLDRLCKRCHEQLEWKIRFQKYKPATSVSKW